MRSRAVRLKWTGLCFDIALSSTVLCETVVIVSLSTAVGNGNSIHPLDTKINDFVSITLPSKKNIEINKKRAHYMVTAIDIYTTIGYTISSERNHNSHPGSDSEHNQYPKRRREYEPTPEGRREGESFAKAPGNRESNRERGGREPHY